MSRKGSCALCVRAVAPGSGLRAVGLGLLTAWVALLTIAAPIDAQRLPFRTYSSDHGLAQSVVLSMAQDRDGFLWLGTPDGTSRFDGLEFVTFGARDGLGDGVVRSLHLARDGSVWAGTDRGLAVWSDGAWTAHTADEGPLAASVRAFAVASERLWIGTYDGLVAVDWSDGAWFPVDRLGLPPLPDPRIRSLFVDIDETLWVGTYGGGAFQLVDGAWRAYGADEGLGDPVVRALGHGPRGELLAATDHGVWMFDGERFTAYEPAAALADTTVTALRVDRRGRLWLGTRDRGACRIDDALDCIGFDDGLADDSVTSLFEDREGNLWVGTFGGVSRLATESFRSYGLGDGLEQPSVRAIAQSRDGALWLGTHGGGVEQIVDGRLVERSARAPTSAERASVDRTKVVSAATDRDGTVWFGLLDGLARLEDGTLRRVEPPARVGGPVLALLEARDGTRWIGTDDGLVAWSPDGTLRWWRESDGLPDRRVNHLLEGRPGILWLATAAGIVRLRTSGGTSGGEVSVERVWDDADGLPDAYVDHLLLDAANSVLWAASAGGLVRLDLGTDALYVFGVDDGLLHDKVTALVADEAGRLWIGTTRGIHMYDGNLFTPFSSDDGLPSAEVNSGAAFLDAAGKVWLGTVRGAVVFEPEAAARRVPAPPVHLLRVEVNETPLPLDGPEAVGGDARESSVTLGPRENHLRFEYVALSLAFPEAVRYEVRLDGAEPTWRQTTAREISYPALPAGDYVFRVRALARGGVPSLGEESFAFTVRRPLWRTAGFQLAAVALLALLAFGFHRWRLELLRQRNVALHRQIERRRRAEHEARRYARQLEHRNLHDPLTDLPNRAVMRDRVEVALERLRRHPEAGFSVLWIDLDRFKLVNDSHGHRAGDRLLTACAARLKAAAGEGVTVTRLSGDEFAVLLDDVAGPTEATRAAAALQDAIAVPIPLDAAPSGTATAPAEIRLTASVGIVVVRGPRVPRPGEVLRDADTALYRAKAAGRGGCIVFDPLMHARAVETLRLDTDLRRALEHDQFELVYQPIVDLESSRIVCFEALLRWRHPERGVLRPGDFLDRVLETGLHRPLGRWVLRRAARQAAAWRRLESGAGVAVGVNLFDRQIVRSDLADELAALLEETGLAPDGLHLEITETVLIEKPDAAVASLEALREIGFEISLDDFGTGYSSLAYLQRFPVDVLKIDREFVRQIGEDDEDSDAIVEAILYLARRLGLLVVAEGVETEVQLERLRHLGCDRAQGFHIARPLDLAAATALLETSAEGVVP